eukprot:8895616-Pyramimonas_sp.AAC.1
MESRQTASMAPHVASMAAPVSSMRTPSHSPTACLWKKAPMLASREATCVLVKRACAPKALMAACPAMVSPNRCSTGLLVTLSKRVSSRAVAM